MSFRRGFKREDWANPEAWDQLDINTLPTDIRETCEKRMRGIDLILISGVGYKEAAELVQVSESELYRLIARALSERADTGEPFGYQAAVPYARLPKTEDEQRRGGRFQMFLAQQPRLTLKLDAFILGKRRVTYTVAGKQKCEKVPVEPNWRLSSLHRYFVQLCEDHGLTPQDYPLNIESQARESLRVYANRLVEISRIKRTSKEEGTVLHLPILQPYEEVQFDEHQVDVIGAIGLPQPNGTIVWRSFDRMWILVLKCVGSRASLGYSVSYGKRYNLEDVTEAFVNSLKPWKPLEPAFEGLTYADGAGFPSGVINGCEYRCFDLVRVDNDLCHRSPEFIKNIQDTLQATVNLGPASLPESRPVIERFFGYLEQIGFHRLPSTTGSHPKDPERQANAVQNAIDKRITNDTIVGILDVLLANDNANIKDKLNGISPLDAIRQHMDFNLQFVRQVPAKQREPLGLVYRYYKKRIRKATSSGRPYVYFLGAEYVNEALAERIDLVGREIIFRVNIYNIQTAYVTLAENGLPLGVVIAKKPWGWRPHSLKERQLIRKLKKQGDINYEGSDPIRVFQQFLLSQSPTSSGAASALLAHLQSQARASAQPGASVSDQESQSSEQNEVSMPIVVPEIRVLDVLASTGIADKEEGK